MALQFILPLFLFFTILPFSFFAFNSTQFKLHEGGQKENVLKERIKSIIDTSETSNQGRIAIWKATLRSMAQNPVLGVGIGNFPTILELNPTAIKAGASAHNLFLNVFAELGMLGFIIFLLMLYEVFKVGWQLFSVDGYLSLSGFFGANALIYLIWILWYSMTDVAIFDERAFLLLMIMTGSLFALKNGFKKDGKSIGFN